MTNKEIKAIHKKWEPLMNTHGLSGDSSVQNVWDNIRFPKMMGSEPKEHVLKRKRFQTMRDTLGDDTFFDIISEKEYDDFLNEKFLPPARTIAQDLVSVKPLSAPSLDIMYMDYTYESIDESLALEKQELRLKKIEEIIHIKKED